MSYSRSRDYGNPFRSPLLTTTKVCQGGSQGEPCRVCGEPLVIGDTYRARAWGIELAHERCGWFRPDEGAPTAKRKPGTTFEFIEWRCSECGLDACLPATDTTIEALVLGLRDLRCGRCTAPVVGEVAELLATVRVPSTDAHSFTTGCMVAVLALDDDGLATVEANGVKFRVRRGLLARRKRVLTSTHDQRGERARGAP